MKIVAKSLLAFLLLSPALVSAQSRTAITIAAGPSAPIGRLRDTQRQGVDMGIGFIRGSDDSPLGVRIDFDYDRLPGKTVGSVRNADRKVAAGTLDFVLSTSGYTVKPYVMAGVGGFKMTSPVLSQAKTRFGFDFGVGFTLPMANRAFFLESRINSISQPKAKPLRYVPIVLGLLF